MKIDDLKLTLDQALREGGFLGIRPRRNFARGSHHGGLPAMVRDQHSHFPRTPALQREHP
jgi:hypothetical protein